jgi:putative ABC transport system permease protein
MTRPPKLVDWLLRHSLPRGPAGDSIRGDLLEDLLASGDRPAARLRYRVDALSIVARYALRRAPQPHGNPSHRRNSMETIRQDLKYAARSLLKRRSFSLMVITTLALGIGANTAIFTIVNAVLLRPLPFDEPERLVVLYERNVIGDEQRQSVAPGNFLDWRQASTSFEHMTAQTTRTVTVTRDTPGAEAERVGMCVCSGNLFSTLRVSPVAGRSFRADEDRNGAPRAVVIAFELWQRQFGGAADAVGKSIRLDNEAYEVIGVAPRGFSYPNRAVEAWLPILTQIPPQQQIRHDLHYLRVIARLRDGISMEQAGAELDGIASRYKAAHPNEATGAGATVIPLHDDLVGETRRPLAVLSGAVLCVLLIACLNIANLMLTRAAARTREIGIRAALGASRGRIIRQLVTESVVLGLAGGAVGLMLALWVANVLVKRAPGVDAILPSGQVPIDLPVFLFAFSIALGAGVAVGLFPAIRGSRADVTTDLKDGSRTSTASRGHGRLRDVLIAAEVALSLVLLTVAGLLVHSFSRLYDVQPGVRIDNTLTMGTFLAGPGYRNAATRSALLDQLGDRLRTLPGVASAGLVSCAPLTGQCNTLFFYIEGRPYVPGKFFAAFERSADPGYFAAAGIPLLHGRTFARNDGVGDAKSPRLGSIVISESMAKRFFPGEDPLGKRIFFDFEMQRERLEGFPAPRYEVIGIVGDVLPALDQAITPTLYRPMLDVAPRGASILLHTKVEPRSVVSAAREEIRRLDPGLTTFQVLTMEDLLGRSTSDRRFSLLLVVSFAALAVLLAAVGLYGVVSYAVSQRTAEIGLRMALGATNSTVCRMMLMQGLKPTIVGMSVGLVVAAFSTKVVRSLLFGVTPTDPLTFGLVPPLLLVLATLACYLPARRATRLDPTVALRAE